MLPRIPRRTKWDCCVAALIFTACIGYVASTEGECEAAFFKCHSGDILCVSKAFVCDGESDCTDSSDERSCDSPVSVHERVVCKEDSEFTCQDGQCIMKSWLCDGHMDCPDESDEDPIECNKIACDGKICEIDKKCIHKNQTCDGVIDCADGSDEIECSSWLSLSSDCNEMHGMFPCYDEKRCLLLSQVCNGQSDCLDSSDEGELCNIHTCDVNCSHICQPFPHGPKCICPKGSSLTLDGSCIDIDECASEEHFALCDQLCINHANGYTCSCNDGYKLINNSCRAEGEATLLFTAGNEVRILYFSSQVYDIVASDAPVPSGISFDGIHVYWATIMAGYEAIYRSTEVGTSKELLFTAGLGQVEDLSVDWITKNIYFTDSIAKHLAACSGDGMLCTVLITEGLEKPRGLVLHSTKGEMYFTDWGAKPKISKASMDGSNVLDIITKGIVWPNGLAIDFGTERLYWADGNKGCIEYANLDGTNRKIVKNLPLLRPFALDVFEDSIYWSELTGRYEIMSCHKLTGKNCKTVIRHHQSPIIGFHIYHPVLLGKETKNPCNGAECSDLCLLTNKEGAKDLHYTCACPAEKELSTNKHSCTKVERTQFLIAGSGHQLFLIFPQKLGKYKIQEIENHKVSNIGALAFDSLGGHIIIADKSTNMVTLYDFANNETKTTFHISSSLEITEMDFDYYGNNIYWIDGVKKTAGIVSLIKHEQTTLVNDFGGETPLSIALVPEESIMFIALRANDSSIHIDQFSMDGSLTSRVRRVSDHFVGPTVSLFYDHHTHRIFWSDMGSGNINSLAVDDASILKLVEVKYSSVFTVASVGNDVFWTQLHSNELFWTSKSSPDSIKRTILGEISSDQPLRLVKTGEGVRSDNGCHRDNGGCSHICLYIHQREVCKCPLGLTLAHDGKACVQRQRCEVDEFMCANGDCIPIHKKCDTNNDCHQGEDEQSCKSYTCPLGTFACKNGLQCISSYLVCNSVVDCADNSDEINCAVSHECSSSEFQCLSGECIHSAFMCDDKSDCSDGSDEAGCQSRSCDSTNQFRCASGACIPLSWECDGAIECDDASDEHSNCNVTKTCSPNELQCSNGHCVDKHFVCNGEDDCEDGTDELNCKREPASPEGRTCSAKQFTCQLNNTCVPLASRCDGKADCPLGDDEKGCDGCGLEEFQCTSSRQCIRDRWRCDGVSDCADHSDEDNCPEKATTVHKTDETCLGIRCSDTGLCVEWKNVCNNISDCVDSSDEGRLCGKSCQNSGCEECHETPVGYQCSCPKGYRLLSDGKKCVDIDECAFPYSCSQFCQNTVGSFKCSCREDSYHLRNDRTSCKARGSDMEYVFATGTEIRLKSKSLTRVDLVYKSSRPHIIKGMDVDMVSKIVYWSSELTGTLYKISINDPSETQAIKGIIKPGKVALDWVSGLVYFTERGRFIRACDFNLQKCSTIHECHLDATVEALRIDAVARKLYWSETTMLGSRDSKATVKQSDMSGANVLHLPDGSHQKITDISVDDIRKSLYIIDSYTGKVQLLDLESLSSWNLMYSVEGKPTDINLFEGDIYWLNKMKTERAAINLGRNNIISKCGVAGSSYWECEFISLLPEYSLETIQRLRISHPALQPTGLDLCLDNAMSCTHMCISDNRAAVCICEDGTYVKRGQQCPPVQGSVSNYVFSNLIEEFQINPNSESSTVSFWSIFFILLIFLGLSAFAVYYYFGSRKEKCHLETVHFQNPTYEMGGFDHQPIYDPVYTVSPGQHQYENPIAFKPSDGNANNTMTIMRGDGEMRLLNDSGLDEKSQALYFMSMDS